MVNKHVLRETFMKLESYDRVNVISDILRLSNSLELEFYSSVIENILQYHKLSTNGLREELNHNDNFKHLFDFDCVDSSVRSKLISTLSLLKASNFNGASQIFDFLRQNHSKLKKQAHDNPDAYEEVLLIYQLANDHPAFSFDHCQEIYDYLTQIRSISVSRDYFTAKNDEYINDLNVLSIIKNEKQEYMFRIKVQWDKFECCIIRTLEDIYNFYQKICEMFPAEVKSGEICNFYISYIPDNLDLSRNLMATFLRDFMNSPQLILRCDFVRQFFKPQKTDKDICKCDNCHINFNKLHWTGTRKFEPILKCDNDKNDQDNEYMQSYDNKADTPCSSNFNYSISSKRHIDNNTPLEVIVSNRICSEDDSESLKSRRCNTKKYHSTGSSPINTPSDESETCSKNESLRNQNNGCNHQLSIVAESTNTSLALKDMRTEDWISQSNEPYTITDLSSKSNIDYAFQKEEYAENNDEEIPDVCNINTYKIGNLLEWLKHTRLHKYHDKLSHMNFGKFYSLSEEFLNDLGFVEGAAKKLVSLILKIKKSDIIYVDSETINIKLRERSNSTDSGTSVFSSSGEYASVKCESSQELIHQEVQANFVSPYRLIIPSNMFLLPQNYIQNYILFPSDISDNLYHGKKPCNPQ